MEESQALLTHYFDKVEALERCTISEPLEWSVYYIARARALADCGRGGRGGGTNYTSLLALAQNAHLSMASLALEQALEQA